MIQDTAGIVGIVAHVQCGVEVETSRAGHVVGDVVGALVVVCAVQQVRVETSRVASCQSRAAHCWSASERDYVKDEVRRTWHPLGYSTRALVEVGNVIWIRVEIG